MPCRFLECTCHQSQSFLGSPCLRLLCYHVSGCLVYGGLVGTLEPSVSGRQHENFMMSTGKLFVSYWKSQFFTSFFTLKSLTCGHGHVSCIIAQDLDNLKPEEGKASSIIHSELHFSFKKTILLLLSALFGEDKRSNVTFWSNKRPPNAFLLENYFCITNLYF